MTPREPLRIWSVSDGRAGMENQVLGLAEAVARLTPAHIEIKRIAITPPYDRLPTALWGRAEKRLALGADSLSPPLPDLWIACGRRTVPFSIRMRGKGPLVVQTQHPRVATRKFDLVVPPVHDNLVGPNVFPIVGAPNRLSIGRLLADSRALGPFLSTLPEPRAAVLIGGDSKAFKMTRRAIDRLVATVAAASEAGFGLMISASRRTPASVLPALREALPARGVWVWDGAPVAGLDNPYFGILGLADRILVTEESTNMITDAAYTGKPVHLMRLEGGTPKWGRFHEELRARGIIREEVPLTSDWRYTPLRETDRVAQHILNLLTLREKTRDIQRDDDGVLSSSRI